MSYAETILETPGLVNYWQLNEASGTVAKDSTGAANGKYVAAEGAALVYRQPSRVVGGAGIYLNGEYTTGKEGPTALVELPTAACKLSTFSLEFASIEFHEFAGESIPRFNDQRIFSNISEANGSHGWLLGNLKTGKIVFLVQSPTNETSWITSNSLLALETKYQIALTYAAGVVNLYINGVQAETTTGGSAAFPATIQYENWHPGIGGPATVARYSPKWVGSDVAFYSTALTASVVKEHYVRAAEGTNFAKRLRENMLPWR